MTTSLTTTTVSDMAAAHLTVTRASTSTHDELTIVWSTTWVRCEPGDPNHAVARWDAESVPMVWDSTGCGDWEIGEHVQCGQDGRLLYPHARLIDGHLDAEAIAEVAAEIADERVDERATELAGIFCHLTAQVREYLAADEERRGEMVTDVYTPGIYLGDGEPIAWDYDPADDEGRIIQVAASDLYEQVEVES